jgi:hypothetical protein
VFSLASASSDVIGHHADGVGYFAGGRASLEAIVDVSGSATRASRGVVECRQEVSDGLRWPVAASPVRPNPGADRGPGQPVGVMWE